MILLTGCSTKPKSLPTEPVIINKTIYVLPPDFLLKECSGEPADNRMQSVITEQKRIIDDCNAQLLLLRIWKKEREQSQNN